MLTSWVPMAYIYYNGFLLACILWSLINTEASDPVLLSLMLNVISIVMDIVVLATSYPYQKVAFLQSSVAGLFRFSAVMCCVNLLLRPVTSIVMYRVMQARSAEYSSFTQYGGGFSGHGETYENIDQPVPTAPAVANSDFVDASPSKAAYQSP
ncbi:PREDICTED: type-1 angiotensin II receptor-associated protein-like isoform X2 [Priapulus caudatus]|nr:PREDICTED: type-1 angiotensin II receptor-associated protein-like isoform X2 [Priapulus caudatus]